MISFLETLPKIPPDGVCPKCSWFFTDHPQVIARAEALGRELSMFACRCDAMAQEVETAAQHRMDTANLPKRDSSFGSFTLREGLGIRAAFKAAQEFAQNEGPPVVVFVGGTGVGKSHLLESIGRVVLAAGSRARYDLAGVLIDQFRFASSRGADMDGFALMKWYQEFPVLLIDDLGAERATDFATEKLTVLLEDRLMNGGRIAFATNLGETAIREMYGPRLASRLFDVSGPERSMVFPIDATDYRSEKHAAK